VSGKRLKILNLTTLETRHIRGDLIGVFKMNKSIAAENAATLRDQNILKWLKTKNIET